jgi:hypothetical protein
VGVLLTDMCVARQPWAAPTTGRPTARHFINSTRSNTSAHSIKCLNKGTDTCTSSRPCRVCVLAGSCAVTTPLQILRNRTSRCFLASQTCHTLQLQCAAQFFAGCQLMLASIKTQCPCMSLQSTKIAFFTDLGNTRYMPWIKCLKCVLYSWKFTTFHKTSKVMWRTALMINKIVFPTTNRHRLIAFLVPRYELASGYFNRREFSPPPPGHLNETLYGIWIGRVSILSWPYRTQKLTFPLGVTQA